MTLLELSQNQSLSPSAASANGISGYGAIGNLSTYSMNIIDELA